MKNAIPILMYHLVAPQSAPAFRKYTVAPRAFAAQMAWLAAAGYTPIDLDAWLDQRWGERSLPNKPIVITFDDGFQDCVKYALPSLKRRGFTAVFYLIAGLMGKTSQWLLSDRGIEFPIMDWANAQHLLATGFQCGSHSMSHPHLAELSVIDCQNELQQSRRLLEDKLGHEVKHLAYPFGSFNERVRSIAAEAGYRSACSVKIGFSTPNDDALALRRVPIIGQDSLIDFIFRLHTTRSLSEWVNSKARGGYQRVQRIGTHS